MAMQEVLTGLLIGFAMGLVFAGVRAAGELIGFDLGLSIATAFDPETGSNNIVGAFLYLVMLLVFILVNGHHFVLQALVLSYDAIPIGGFTLSGPVADQLLGMTGIIFIVGVKCAAPIIVASFLMNVALAILSRVAPQVNVFMVEFSGEDRCRSDRADGSRPAHRLRLQEPVDRVRRGHCATDSGDVTSTRRQNCSGKNPGRTVNQTSGWDDPAHIEWCNRPIPGQGLCQSRAVHAVSPNVVDLETMSIVISLGHGMVPTIFWSADAEGVLRSHEKRLDPDGCLVQQRHRHFKNVRQRQRETRGRKDKEPGFGGVEATLARKVVWEGPFS